MLPVIKDNPLKIAKNILPPSNLGDIFNYVKKFIWALVKIAILKRLKKVFFVAGLIIILILGIIVGYIINKT